MIVYFLCFFRMYHFVSSTPYSNGDGPVRHMIKHSAHDARTLLARTTNTSPLPISTMAEETTIPYGFQLTRKPVLLLGIRSQALLAIPIG